MFDINDALNKIIYKYDLDKHYPNYCIADNCEKLLKKYIDIHCSRNEYILFLCNNKLELDILSHISQGNKFVEQVIYKDICENIQWEKYKEIYIMSFEKHKDISGYLKQIQVNHIWVYDIFNNCDCVCDRDFYKLHLDDYNENFSDCFPGKEGWRNIVQLELYNCQKRYKGIKDKKIKEQELEKCLFLSLHMRNFEKASYYFNKLSKKDNKYAKAHQEVKELLKEIKKRVKENSDKNIVMYWMDAISYEESEDMLYLQQQMKKSVVFENAFTSTPFTFPTAKNMFLGKYTIDDKIYGIKRIKIEDSEPLTLLIDRGYDIKTISGYMGWFDYEFRSAKRHELYDTCSTILWDLLNNLVNQKNKTFYIVHMLVEGHYPHMNFRMSKKSLSNNRLRCMHGRKEMDEQLEFYDKFLNDNSYRIYMSDHGKKEFCTRYHIVLSIYGKNIRNKVIKEMYSIVDFGKLLKQIVEKGCIDERELKREYVKIQGLDWYNSKLIRKLMLEKNMPDMFLIGYTGVITREKMYIRFRTGKEWLNIRNNAKYEPFIWGECDCSDDEIEMLRRYTGDYPAEIANDELFKYSKYVYRLIQKYDIRLNEYINFICSELDKYPANSIAIRMGGEHSMQLYTRMSSEYKDKIACFVDNAKSCLCSKYGLPIIGLDELENMGIKAVILSSYDHLEMLREEAKVYPKNIDIIDVYSILEKNDVYCTNNFYMDIKLKDEDYDVGFPFEEFE